MGCANLEAPVRVFSAESWRSDTPEITDKDWEETPPETIEILIVEPGHGKGMFGHAGIHIGEFAYSWDYLGGYLLVRQRFRTFLRIYTFKYNREVKGVTIRYPQEAIASLLTDLNDENYRTWQGTYRRSPLLFLSNCSTLVFRKIVDASGEKNKPWPPVLIPSWMGKNVERSFPLLYYTTYQRSVPVR